MPWSSQELLPSKLHWPRGQLVLNEAIGAVSVAVVSAGGGTAVSVGAGGGTLTEPKPMLSSRLGEPGPRLESTPVVAAPVMAAATSDGVAEGCCSSYSAAAPATWGDAMEVPLPIVVAVSDG